MSAPAPIGPTCAGCGEPSPSLTDGRCYRCRALMRPRPGLAKAPPPSTAWVWRTLLTVDARPWLLQHGLDAGQEKLHAEVEEIAKRAVAALEWEGPPSGHLAAVRCVPHAWTALTELWPGLDDERYVRSAVAVLVRVPVARPEVLSRLRRMAPAPAVPLGPVHTCERSPWSTLAGFRLAAAVAFLRHVFGAGVAPGWWMVEGTGVVTPDGVAECDSILAVLEQEQLVRRGEYAPHPQAVYLTAAGGERGYNVLRRERPAFGRYLEGDPVHFAHYLWHAVEENELRARALIAAVEVAP